MNNCFITIAEITFLSPRPIPFCYLHGLDLVGAHSLSPLKAQKYMSVGAHVSLKPWGLSWFITSCILLGRIGVPFYFHACTTLHCTQINDRCWDWLESTRQWCRLVLSEIPEGSLVAAFRQTDRALRFSWSWACFIVPRSCVRLISTPDLNPDGVRST
jgi:hypothetical protein